ncbi:complement factor H-like [Archocentrus centrarchus]|uniref:complement factor H-like n=1 Tax=Archocentrus centrarchus TaxID=63155 RepID=UPI0011EA2684|nr:complement factor H-like [Archocentrus centrarchus]
MCLRSLGFVLILFPGVLQAQGCDAPRLPHGYCLPQQETYSNGATITYACDNGYKPAVEMWWATSTCQHGTWYHEPQCIGESSCLPPTISNAKYPENLNSWYEDGSTLRITCEAGFEHKNQNTTITCENGNWSPVPVCEKSISACSAPPKIPHAVIINQGYQEVFAAGSQVQYHCEDAYTNVGQNTIICEAGLWTTGPTCKTLRGAGHGGSTVTGTEVSHTTPAGSGTQPGHTDSSEQTETSLRFIAIDNCGQFPVIPNGVITETTRFSLKYECQHLYKLVGPATVKCIRSGMWSDLPVCRAAFCAVNTDDNPQYISVGTVYIPVGEEKRVECVKPHSWSFNHYSTVRCFNGRVEATECCNKLEHALSCD